ncbi:hypothetical protein D3C76_1844410 [compost metagenome]
MRQAVGERHNDSGAFLGEAKHTGLLTAHRRWQRQAGENRQGGIGFTVRQQNLYVHTEAWPEVIA